MCLWTDDATKQDPETAEAEPKKSESLIEQKAGASSLSCSTLPCIDKLREELSCAVRIFSHLWCLSLLDAYFIPNCFIFFVNSFHRFAWKFALNLVPHLVDTGNP